MFTTKARNKGHLNHRQSNEEDHKIRNTCREQVYEIIKT